MTQATPPASTSPAAQACLVQRVGGGAPPARAARRLPGLAVMLVIAGATAGPAHAELPLWELGIGLGVLRVPHYRGSEQDHTWLLPVPYLVYRGEIFRSDREGTRALLVDTERADLDLSLGAGPPASSRDNRARAGMPDLAPSVEFGPRLNLRLAKGAGWRVDMRLPVRAVVTVGKPSSAIGWLSSPVLDLALRRHGWTVGLQGGPLFASRRYHAYYYDVDPAYATAARAAFRSDGGFAGWGLTASASSRFGDWWLGAYLRVDSVAGARFAGSPLVTRRDNLGIGLAASWIFKVSDERVAERG